MRVVPRYFQSHNLQVHNPSHTLGPLSYAEVLGAEEAHRGWRARDMEEDRMASNTCWPNREETRRAGRMGADPDRSIVTEFLMMLQKFCSPWFSPCLHWFIIHYHYVQLCLIVRISPYQDHGLLGFQTCYGWNLSYLLFSAYPNRTCISVAHEPFMALCRILCSSMGYQCHYFFLVIRVFYWSKYISHKWKFIRIFNNIVNKVANKLNVKKMLSCD